MDMWGDMKSGREELLGATDLGFIKWLDLSQDISGLESVNDPVLGQMKELYWEEYLDVLEETDIAIKQINREYEIRVGSIGSEC